MVIVDKTKHVASPLYLILFLTSFNLPRNFYIQIIYIYFFHFYYFYSMRSFGLQKFLSNDLKSSLAHAHIYGELIF